MILTTSIALALTSAQAVTVDINQPNRFNFNFLCFFQPDNIGCDATPVEMPACSADASVKKLEIPGLKRATKHTDAKCGDRCVIPVNKGKFELIPVGGTDKGDGTATVPRGWDGSYYWRYSGSMGTCDSSGHCGSWDSDKYESLCPTYCTKETGFIGTKDEMCGSFCELWSGKQGKCNRDGECQEDMEAAEAGCTIFPQEIYTCGGGEFERNQWLVALVDRWMDQKEGQCGDTCHMPGGKWEVVEVNNGGDVWKYTQPDGSEVPTGSCMMNGVCGNHAENGGCPVTCDFTKGYHCGSFCELWNGKQGRCHNDGRCMENQNAAEASCPRIKAEVTACWNDNFPSDRATATRATACGDSCVRADSPFTLVDVPNGSDKWEVSRIWGNCQSNGKCGDAEAAGGCASKCTSAWTCGDYCERWNGRQGKCDAGGNCVLDQNKAEATCGTAKATVYGCRSESYPGDKATVISQDCGATCHRATQFELEARQGTDQWKMTSFEWGSCSEAGKCVSHSSFKGCTVRCPSYFQCGDYCELYDGRQGKCNRSGVCDANQRSAQNSCDPCYSKKRPGEACAAGSTCNNCCYGSYWTGGIPAVRCRSAPGRRLMANL